MRLYTRSIRPPDDIAPNPNPPSSVGPDGGVVPGDPHGVTVEGEYNPPTPPARILASAWSGWPAEWWPPTWQGSRALTATAWNCLDLNSSVLATMPPYLVDVPPSGINADWLKNPEPDVYASWEDFAKQLFWDYQLGEAFVLATADYATGYPARFYLVPPWAVEVELVNGLRRYKLGDKDITADVLHIRYRASVGDARGQGPLEAGGAYVTAADALLRYATTLTAGGGIPPSLLKHHDEIGPEKAAALKAQWVQSRLSSIGEPAVLDGGIEWQPTSVNPRDMALIELLQFNESRIAVLLGVPPFLVGLPAGGDSLTYANVTSIFDYHWRAGLRPKAAAVMAALSEWALPRGIGIELNRDAYVAPAPLERAQTAQIYNSIVDAKGNPALTVDEIREVERVENADVVASSPVSA